MTNYMPVIATQILNIDLYSLFRVKCKEIKTHGNQTYYLGYDGLHSTKDEINTDSELLNKIITGKAEIVYLKDKKKIPENTTVKDLEINAIADRFRLGNLNLMEWRLIYYLIGKNINKNRTHTVSLKEFEYIYNYSCNILTKEKTTLELLLKKKILLNYKKLENKQIEITFSDILLNNIQTTNYKYKIKEISNFKHIASYLLYDYLINQLKEENFKIIYLKINDFKMICSIKSKQYSKYENLKRRIIIPVLEEINNYTNEHNHGLTIFHDNIKKNRAVAGIEFTIIRKADS